MVCATNFLQSARCAWVQWWRPLAARASGPARVFLPELHCGLISWSMSWVMTWMSDNVFVVGIPFTAI